MIKKIMLMPLQLKIMGNLFECMLIIILSLKFLLLPHLVLCNKSNTITKKNSQLNFYKEKFATTQLFSKKMLLIPKRNLKVSKNFLKKLFQKLFNITVLPPRSWGIFIMKNSNGQLEYASWANLLHRTIFPMIQLIRLIRG